MLRRDADGIAHIGGLSGGKDSVAMALLLIEREPRPYNWVCTPTGDELPSMIAHWDRLEQLLGQPLIRLTNGTLASVIATNNMLPNCHARFCTRILKLKPYGAFMAEAAPAVSYIGLRADEDEREGTRPGGDYAGRNAHVDQDFPLKRWGMTIDDVYATLAERGIEIPERTDCARCPYQKLGEWYNLWHDHPDIYADAIADEKRHGHTFRSDQRDSWPAALEDLGALFAAGKIPERSLRMMEKRKGMCRHCSM
jgi:3'-phosphoadenosine 5'-phosphosulfate sulfotransferase (PAPS reductase)/FAD synthetase